MLNRDKKKHGYTLLECVISMSIISIVLLFTVNYLMNFKNQQMLNSQVYLLKQKIYHAKILALKTNSNVFLKPLNTDWNQGLCLSGRDISECSTWDVVNISVRWKGVNEGDVLIFKPDIIDNSISGHFILTMPNDNVTKITLNRFGSIRVSQL